MKGILQHRHECCNFVWQSVPVMSWTRLVDFVDQCGPGDYYVVSQPFSTLYLKSKPTCLWPEEFNFKVKCTFFDCCIYIYVNGTTMWILHFLGLFTVLLLHVILNECLEPFSAHLLINKYIHPSGVLTVISVIWLLHGCCHVKLLPSQCMFCVHYTTMHQVQCQFMQSQRERVHGSFTCYCSNMMVEQIWNWRRKFSCRDSNPWPFDHESGALSTELSQLPIFTLKCRAGLIEFSK